MNHQMSSPYGYDVSPPNFGFDQGPSSNSFSFGMMSPLPPPPPPAPMPGFPGHMTQYSNMGQMPAGHMPAPLPRESVCLPVPLHSHPSFPLCPCRVASFKIFVLTCSDLLWTHPASTV
mmetsp:Transcript_14903/g.48639  ORF Transcript_14903/g.48639 Transcript_14903/m.48639 type:complete len:118 (-) Transcript_14903:942-1295(-)